MCGLGKGVQRTKKRVQTHVHFQEAHPALHRNWLVVWTKNTTPTQALSLENIVQSLTEAFPNAPNFK